MPFGLLNAATSHQCYMQGVLAAHEARRQAIVMEEVLDPREPLGPPDPLGGRFFVWPEVVAWKEGDGVEDDVGHGVQEAEGEAAVAHGFV